jgi:hypothetical protein
MRSYPRQETVKFRNNASEEVVRRLGVSVLDPSPVSGPLLPSLRRPKACTRQHSTFSTCRGRRSWTAA